MSTEEKNIITNNLKYLTVIMGLLVSAFGFLVNRTLNSIDNNIVDLRLQLEKRTELVNSHEARIGINDTRLRSLEEEVRSKRYTGNK